MSTRRVRCFFCGNLAVPKPTHDQIFVGEVLTVERKRGCICSECVEYLYETCCEFFPDMSESFLDSINGESSYESPTFRKAPANESKISKEVSPKEKYPCLEYSISSIIKLLSDKIYGQEDVLSRVVYTIYHNQMANLLEDLGSPAPPRENLLLIGPTGVGKTFISETVLSAMKINYAKSDATAITSAGYIGDKVEDILPRLYHASKKNIEKAQNGVVIIDEFDKKRSTETNFKDVNGLSVQQELLKVLEPSTVWIENGNVSFDTSRLTVILCGAFVGLDKIVEKRLNKNIIGFSTERDIKIDPLSNIESEDFVTYGFIREIVGRMPNPIVLTPLAKDKIIDIIYLCLNEQNYLFTSKGFELIVDPFLIDKIADRVMSHKTGARDIRKEVSSLLYRAKFKVLESAPGGGICEIDEQGRTSILYNSLLKKTEVMEFPGAKYFQEGE